MTSLNSSSLKLLVVNLDPSNLPFYLEQWFNRFGLSLLAVRPGELLILAKTKMELLNRLEKLQNDRF